MAQMNPAKRVAIIIDSLAGGGAEKVMLTLAEHMASMGHKVTLFSLRNASQYDVPSTINVVFPFQSYSRRLRGFFNRPALANMLEKNVKQIEDADKPFNLTLVNLHESYRIVSACNLNHCFYVIHNSYVQELKREKLLGPVKYFQMRKILSYLDKKNLIAVSKGVASELKSADLFSASSVTHIYNPFDIANIKTLSHEYEPNIEDIEAPYILHVGRAAKAKRHDLLFKALQKVDPKYKLVCLSKNEKKLKKLAEKYHVEDRLIVIGFTQNPYVWMRQATLTILSSDYEGLSMVLIESLLCDTPVVSTNCPHGPSEILQNELLPFLVPTNDSKALAKAINEAIINKPRINNIPILQEVACEKITKQYLDLCSD
ncbi:MAG: glycosyltransferase involved in cell wall biosynthesis [Kangiellaceae bacterium]|jgi:glycosyltransferase involved in cell wall biosynthesis